MGPGSDYIGGDAVLSELQRPYFGHGQDGALGGGVAGAQGLAEMSAARDVDNAPESLGFHPRCYCLRTEY